MKYTVNKKIWFSVLLLLLLFVLLFVFLMVYPKTSRFSEENTLGFVASIILFIVAFRFKNESVQLFDDHFVYTNPSKKVQKIYWKDVEMIYYSGKTKQSAFDGALCIACKSNDKVIETAQISSIFYNYKFLWKTIIDNSKKANEDCSIDIKFNDIIN